jgi:hypothetical protein
MAAPNIVNVGTILGQTKGQAVTTSTADLLENTAGSGKVFKIEHFSVANIDGSATADFTCSFYDSSATTSYPICSTIAIPADATLMITEKPIYLEEGDKITILAGANGDLVAVISWVNIT